MIHVVIGTKAQLIKMAPVMVALRNQGLPYQYISTGQHRDTTHDILDNFGLPGPDQNLYNGSDITSIPQMALWALRIIYRTVRHKAEIFGSDPQGIVLIHGDTFSTLLGAIMGRVAGLRVGHVESGLRSFNWLHPFPEEITRLLTFRLTHVYFCPGEWAVDNLIRYKGDKVNVQDNTIKDALRIAMEAVATAEVSVPSHPYAIVSIHRFENTFSRKALSRVATTVEKVAKQIPVLFVLHKVTEKNLRRFGLFEQLEDVPGVEFHPRYDYFRFIKLVSRAEFVISDGGSNQEECHYLGKPILLLRKATERQEGLGINCVLSRYDPAVIEDFLSHYSRYAIPPSNAGASPSTQIAKTCLQFSKP